MSKKITQDEKDRKKIKRAMKKDKFIDWESVKKKLDKKFSIKTN